MFLITLFGEGGSLPGSEAEHCFFYQKHLVERRTHPEKHPGKREMRRNLLPGLSRRRRRRSWSRPIPGQSDCRGGNQNPEIATALYPVLLIHNHLSTQSSSPLATGNGLPAPTQRGTLDPGDRPRRRNYAEKEAARIQGAEGTGSEKEFRGVKGASPHP